MNTWHIHIEGQVQGVGFRPFVHLLAKRYGLKGWVNNMVDGVHIQINAGEPLVEKFVEEIAQQPPPLSRITSITRKVVSQNLYDSFQIIHSEEKGDANLLLTPDFATCEACKNELLAVEDRRFQYPFITCTNCGPRYSIIDTLPYDRVNTAMDEFRMCRTCREEYQNVDNRRYYSQTNSCETCGIKMVLFDSNAQKLATSTRDIMDRVIAYWKEGHIVAIKGIGGFLLTCDAKNDDAVRKLRTRKHRPAKPFAIMVPGIEDLDQSTIEDFQAEELQSSVSPIVLMEKKGLPKVSEEVAPGLNNLGVMIPYTPLYQLLLDGFESPIVATSGNLSNAPIMYEDGDAMTHLSPIADFILTHNRKIVIPQDDSVLQYSHFEKQRIILRRARGLAPTYIDPNLKLPEYSVLSLGAMLKSTFTLLHRGNIYISQYLGDLAHFETQQSFKKVIQQFLKIFGTKPQTIICDKHPEYPSTQMAGEIVQKFNGTLHQVQHHIAHFGAILGEHNLIDAENPILGIIWDGTGLGDDGQIWGGEFFKYEKKDFLRCYHFDYFDYILGDKMPKEPRISALSACWDVLGAEDFIKEKFTKTEWQIYTKLLKKEKNLKTSSVGRIFDAVASLLGIMDKQSYEGEAAMRLESIATDYFRKHGLQFDSSYFMEGAHYYRIPTKSLMTNIVMDLNKGKPIAYIAAKFHYSMMKLVKIVADNLKIKQLAFSGGVFQNGLLVDLILHHLKGEYKLYFHKEISPNDENISFGQLVCHHIERQKELLVKNKMNEYVFSDSR